MHPSGDPILKRFRAALDELHNDKTQQAQADEMEGRGILFSYIEAALASPDRVVQDATDPALSRSYKVIPEFGNRVLRVVHRPNCDSIFVVTAHWDRGAKL